MFFLLAGGLLCRGLLGHKTMRFDDTRKGQNNKKSKQADGKADTESESSQGSVGLAFVLDHVEQGGAETHDDSNEHKQDGYLDPHNATSIFIRSYEYNSRYSGYAQMKLARFWFRPSLYPTLSFLLLFPFLLSLGLWQLDRAEEKQILLEDRESRTGAESLDLNWLDEMSEDSRFVPARVKGRYQGRRQWLQDNQVFQGQAGYHVYSLVELDGRAGKLLLVNRGWVSVGADRAQLPNLPLPEGEVQLQGRLDNPASVGLKLGELRLNPYSELNVLPYMDLTVVANDIGMELFPFVLVLDEGQAGSLQRDWTPVEMMGPEKHLGYAVQWFALAFALLIIYLGVNMRRKEKVTSDECRVD